MKSVINYLDLKGRTVSRKELEAIQKQARKDQQIRVDQKILALLKNYPETKSFKIKDIDKSTLGLNGLSALNGLEQLPSNFSDGFSAGLNKAVSSSEIYQYITDTILQLIDSDKELPWKKPWTSGIPGFSATNFDSKKAYRGINAVMLNDIYPSYEVYEYEIPYFLTFKQIEKLGGTLQKGAKGYRVVYFTILYKWEDADAGLEIGTYNKQKFIRWITKNKGKLTIFKRGDYPISTIVSWATIPILKYYNVFNADKIDGIDWKLDQIKPPKEVEPIDIAENIVNAWETKPPIKNKGDQAFYIPLRDSITMPPQDFFDSTQEYYGTLFHELIHSTGHPNRLKRDMSGRFGTPEYAFEELIAELGASFLNGESGILFHNLNNSAAYLKGWRSRLKENMKQDNRFFFRASSAAQAGADLILDRDEEGIPKYMRDDKNKDEAIKEALDNSKKSKAKESKAKSPQNLSQLKKFLTRTPKEVVYYFHFGTKKMEKRTIEKVTSTGLESRNSIGTERFANWNAAKDWTFGKDYAAYVSSTLMGTFAFFYEKPDQKLLDQALQEITTGKKKSPQQLELVLNGKKKSPEGLNGPVDDLIENTDKLLETAAKGQELIEKVKTIPGKVLSIADMLSMKFEKLPFKGKWAEFMQNVPPNLRLMVYGQGKNGKTSFSFQFAEYLSQFGKVLYNLADQGISGTTQDLIRSTGLAKASNIVLSGGRSIDELRQAIKESNPQFIFIDLMNNYEVDPRSFEGFMKQEFPEKAFILVMEATKGEDFRGEGTWLNIVDAKIFCKEFIAYNNGRLGFGEFVIWPERVAQMKRDRGEE